MKKRRSNKKAMAIMTAALVLITTVAIAVAYAFITSRGKITATLFFAAFTDKTFWLVTIVAYVALGTWLLADHRFRADKDVVNENEGEFSKWLTEQDLRKSKDFTVAKYSKLGSVKDGIVLKAEKRDNDIDIVLAAKPIHTLVIGTTGAGKTTGFLNPTIQVLAGTKTKPSMVISDPKGELFDIHASRLEEQGYRVQALDLIEPYYSSRWNPFDVLTARVDKINSIYAMPAEEDTEVKIQILRDEIYENAKDLTDAICPFERSHDMSWQIGARSLINAMILAYCEDYEAGHLDKSQLGFTTLYHTVFDYLSADDDILKQYLYECRDELSKVKGMAKQVLETQDRTLTSYLSEVYKHTEWLSDTGILSMTSESDIDLYSMDEHPTALFIKIPDEKKTRHRLVVLMITQLYKCLVDKTRQNKKNGVTAALELRRSVYFLLDEFGNLPSFNDLDAMITVGRSRKMFFELIIQSYEQLANKYGKEVAAIVKSQCNVKIFLGSDDPNTINEVSTACGKQLVSQTSLTTSLERDTASSGTGTKEVPLIYPTELKNLNNADDFGNAIVLPFGHFAYRSKFTPSFKCASFYGLTKPNEKVVHKPQFFDEKAHIYNIIEKIKKDADIIEEIEELKEQLAGDENAQGSNERNRGELLMRRVEELIGIIPEMMHFNELTLREQKILIDTTISKTENTGLKFKLMEIRALLQEQEKENQK